MEKILGTELAKNIKAEIKEKIANEKYAIKPHLVVIQVGDNPASNVYIRNKEKACNEVGIQFSHYKYPETITEEELIKIVSRLSLDLKVTGILVQLPLPDHINKDKIISEIDPNKDVDGFTLVQSAMLQLGIDSDYRLLPCTAKGIISLIESKTDIEGKNAIVIGRSNIVGKPTAILLQEKNATITLCHSRTKKDIICKYIENADIIVLAIGKAEYFSYDEYFKNIKNKDFIIIDAGINYNEKGKLCGDLDIDSFKDIDYGFYTPVPRGVGPMTIASLLQNIYIAYQFQKDMLWKHRKNLLLEEVGD